MILRVVICLFSFGVFGLHRADIEYSYSPGNDNKIDNEEKLLDRAICGAKIDTFWSFIKNNVDLNKDSKLDANELFDSILNQIKKTNEEEIIKLIKKLDLNKTGRVEFDAYMRDAFGVSYQDLEVSTQARNTNRKDEQPTQLIELQTLFAVEKQKWYFLTDADRPMSYELFYKFVYTDEFPSVRQFESDLFFDAYDRNKNGLLEFDELINVDSIELDLKEKKIGMNVDLNGDNFVNRHEFSLWRMPSVEKHVYDEKQFLFECCDSDRDGFLNKTEVIFNCEMFLRSQLTDYGQVLREALKNTSTTLLTTTKTITKTTTIENNTAAFETNLALNKQEL